MRKSQFFGNMLKLFQCNSLPSLKKRSVGKKKRFLKKVINSICRSQQYCRQVPLPRNQTYKGKKSVIHRKLTFRPVLIVYCEIHIKYKVLISCLKICINVMKDCLLCSLFRQSSKSVLDCHNLNINHLKLLLLLFLGKLFSRFCLIIATNWIVSLERKYRADVHDKTKTEDSTACHF